MNKISVRQAMMLVITMVFSPAVRLFSAFVSGRGNQGSWLAPLIACVLMISFLPILNFFIRRNRNFYQQLEYSFGLYVSKIIGFFYVIWGILLTSVQMRYYAGRVASTIYTEIGMDVFLLVMLFLCIYVLKDGIGTLARMNELLLPLITAVTAVLLIFLTPDIEIKVLAPVNDWRSLVHVAVFNMASLGYVTFTVFFTDEINQREHFKKSGVLLIFSVTLFAVWLFVTVIGTLGPQIIRKLPYPFFAVVKQISVGEFLQHIEAFVITLWILSDFVLISFIGSATVKMIGQMTRSRRREEINIPFFVLCASLVSLMGRTNYELEALSEKVFIPLNLIFLFLIPIITVIAGALKEKTVARKRKNVVYY